MIAMTESRSNNAGVTSPVARSDQCAKLARSTAARTPMPVAWYGRVATDDEADLMLTRQLRVAQPALPPEYTIVASFYDVCSGLLTPQERGRCVGDGGVQLPLPRDGGLVDLLAEAQRPDRRFVAVVCESIERIARITYLSTKIEYELEQAGVALLAADEGINPPGKLSPDNASDVADR